MLFFIWKKYLPGNFKKLFLKMLLNVDKQGFIASEYKNLIFYYQGDDCHDPRSW